MRCDVSSARDDDDDDDNDDDDNDLYRLWMMGTTEVFIIARYYFVIRN